MPRSVVVGDVTIAFNFRNRVNGTEETDYSDFMPISGMRSEIDTFVENAIEEKNADDGDEDGDWECTGWAVYSYDEDYADPRTFADLDAYADYIECVEKHGEAYALRYADIGDHDFDNEYVGCYADEVSFVREDYAQFNEVPGHLDRYIDWDAVAHDWMGNYSSYEGSEGLHVFRD